MEQMQRIAQSDFEWVERYTEQPGLIPKEVRRLTEETWGGEPIQLFAHVDLDANLRLTQAWLMLGAKAVALATKTQEGVWCLRSCARIEIRAVREIPGLSLTRLVIGGVDAEAPLIVARFTHRQRRAVSHIVFCLEQEIKGREQKGLCALEPERELSAGRFRDRSADTIYVDSMLQAVKEAQASVTVNKFAVIWRLLAYLRPYRRQVGLGLFGAIAMTMVSLLPPYLTGVLIDRVIKPFEAGKLEARAAMHLAWATILSLAAVYLIREIFAWIRLRWMSVMGEYVASDLRTTVYDHLHRLSLSYFSSKQTGSIISRVSSDTDRIWDFIAFGVVEVTTSVIMLAGLGAVLISLDWRLGLVVTVPIPIVLTAIFLHGRRMQGLFLRAWRKWSHLTDCLSDTIPGVRVVKAFNREEFETKKFRERNSAVLGEFTRIHHAWTSFWPGLMLSIQVLILIVWILGVPRVLGVSSGISGGISGASLSAGTFVSFVLYMTMFMQPIEIIGQMARMVNRATSSAYRVFEVLDTKPQIVDAEASARLEPIQGKVTLENVYFSYDGVRPILRNVSFEVRAGEMIGLVGPSGSGKTTITNLLARFYDISDGRILIDGVDLKSLETGHYRRQIGMVLQDPYLFHGSILENIRYARPEASLNEVIRASEAANAHKFISQLPHGYDTMVGERGHSLSGGERQRVSIARAILLDPRILILDEATSAVDTETERQIQDALDRLVKGRTVFAIAHRLSTLTRADRLLVIKEGRLVEQGSHQELLAIPNGVFAGLYRLQQELHASSAI
jgi:ATP-binding cassette subfamily B protein